MGDRLSGIEPRRLMWVELMKAISDACRATPPIRRRSARPRPPNLQAMLIKSKRIEIDPLDCEHFTRLEDWFADVKDRYEGPDSAGRRPPAAAPGANPAQRRRAAGAAAAAQAPGRPARAG